MSQREKGAELANDLLSDIGLYSGNGIPAGQCVYISFDELSMLDSADGRECYIYSVALGTAESGFMGDDYELIYRISVDYNGNKTASVYEDFKSYGNTEQDGFFQDESNDGRGDIFSEEIGDGDMYSDEFVDWWGTYVNSGYSLEISDVDTTSFYFSIRWKSATQNTIVSEGWAEIDETGFFAMWGEMGFSLYEDFSAIDIFVSESSEWADLRGQYEYIN